MKKAKTNASRWGVLAVLGLMMALGCDGASSVCSYGIMVSNTSSATLFYPCTIADPIPATTMMSGYIGTHYQVAWLARDVAVNGFVVLAMTPRNQLGMVSGWRDAHISGIARLISLNSEWGPLRGKIEIDRLQVSGHSKGGGGALWAADQLGAILTSTIAFTPWQEQFTTLDGVRSATLIQAAALDIHATRDMTLGEYDLLAADIRKAYFEYTDADHFSWASYGTCHDILSADVVAWMKYYLKGDLSQGAILSSGENKITHIWEDF